MSKHRNSGLFDAMDIAQAKTFLSIVETGNFNKAAEQVHVTQSTVSMRIKTLEDALGQKLFVRNKSGATLTAAGSQFLKHAQAMVRIWEQARHEVSLPDKFTGVLSVGGQFTLWDNLLLNWIPWVRSALPELAIRAEVGHSEGLMHQLIEGLLDIGVMYTPQARPGIVIEELFTDQLILVSTSESTKGPGDEGYVLVDWGPEFNMSYIQAFPDIEQPAITVSHGPLGLQHILDNGGSGYFPLRLAAYYLDEGSLHQVPSTPVFSRPVFMVYPDDRAEDATFNTALQGLRYVASSD